MANGHGSGAGRVSSGAGSGRAGSGAGGKRGGGVGGVCGRCPAGARVKAGRGAGASGWGWVRAGRGGAPGWRGAWGGDGWSRGVSWGIGAGRVVAGRRLGNRGGTGETAAGPLSERWRGDGGMGRSRKRDWGAVSDKRAHICASADILGLFWLRWPGLRSGLAESAGTGSREVTGAGESESRMPGLIVAAPGPRARSDARIGPVGPAPAISMAPKRAVITQSFWGDRGLTQRIGRS
jgi:hypothetical protein